MKNKDTILKEIKTKQGIIKSAKTHISSVESEIEALKEQLVSSREIRAEYRPNMNEVYYFATSDGEVAQERWHNYSWEIHRWELGNCFPTVELVMLDVAYRKLYMQYRRGEIDRFDWFEKHR